jgi:hypothetical protein
VEEKMRTIGSQGRLEPEDSDFVYSKVDRRYFFLDQPNLSLSEIYKRYTTAFAENIEVSEVDFVKKIEQIISGLKENSKESPILNGVYVPFIIPSSLANVDLGEAVNQLLVSVGRNFMLEFPEYEFNNFADSNLTGKIKVSADSRLGDVYKQLEHGDIVGIYFPTFFAGFAIKSQRESLKSLPEKMKLSGALEIACALVGSPNLLMKKADNYPNGLVLAGVEPTDSEAQNYFWYFEAYGWNLNFNYRSMVGPASEYFAGGISIVA